MSSCAFERCVPSSCVLEGGCTIKKEEEKRRAGEDRESSAQTVLPRPRSKPTRKNRDSVIDSWVQK
jgi:hypothetical protein